MTIPAWWTAEALNFIIRGRFQSPSEGTCTWLTAGLTFSVQSIW